MGILPSMATLQLLFLYYIRPMAAPSRTLDAGRFWIAVILAALIAMGLGPLGGLRQVFLLLCVFTPVAIAASAWWNSLGAARMVLERDFSGTATCLLLAWSAAYLPVAAAIVSGFANLPLLSLLSVGAGLYFLFLAACVLRTIPGSAFGSAAMTAIGAAIAMGLVRVLIGTVGGGLYWLASPWVLYLLYMRFGGEVAGLGSGLSSQQGFKRYLESTTLNPRDADAHYQLGLIYQQRRNIAEAESRFRKAAEIDPEDADYLLALGRVLLAQGKAQEALPLLDKAARINPKTSLNEVMREAGAAHLALGNHDEAIRWLRQYTQIREYDPEGLVLYGLALAAVERVAEARAAFQAAIEAADSAPSHRSGQVRPWKNKAKTEIARLAG